MANDRLRADLVVGGLWPGGWCLRTRAPDGKLWLYPPSDTDDWQAALEACIAEVQ